MVLRVALSVRGLQLMRSQAISRRYSGAMMNAFGPPAQHRTCGSNVGNDVPEHDSADVPALDNLNPRSLP